MQVIELEWQIYYESYGWWPIGSAIPHRGLFLTYRFRGINDNWIAVWEKAIREGTPLRVMASWSVEPLLYMEKGQSFYLPEKSKAVSCL